LKNGSAMTRSATNSVYCKLDARGDGVLTWLPHPFKFAAWVPHPFAFFCERAGLQNRLLVQGREVSSARNSFSGQRFANPIAVLRSEFSRQPYWINKPANPPNRAAQGWASDAANLRQLTVISLSQFLPLRNNLLDAGQL
jgi:hypothetical protein